MLSCCDATGYVILTILWLSYLYQTAGRATLQRVNNKWTETRSRRNSTEWHNGLRTPKHRAPCLRRCSRFLFLLVSKSIPAYWIGPRKKTGFQDSIHIPWQLSRQCGIDIPCVCKCSIHICLWSIKCSVTWHLPLVWKSSLIWDRTSCLILCR